MENVAFAVDTERGLLTPVVKDAGDLSVAGLAKKIADALLPHANQQLEKLGVKLLGTSADAIDRAYAGVECISFPGMQYRRDIGRKALADHPTRA